MTQKLGGFTFDDDGVLQTTTDAVSSPESIGGWAVGASAYINDLGASAVPAGAHFLGGFAHDEDGVRYVTSDAPSGAFFHGGLAVRADGAMHVSTEAAQRRLNGIGVRDDGSVCVSSVGVVAPELPDITYYAIYDANAGVYQDSGTTPVASDGDPVGQIQDQTGNGRHITQTSAAAKPVYKTNQVNGLPTIRHAAGDILVAATAADWKFLHDGTQFAVYVVYKTTSTNPDALNVLLDTGGVASGDIGAAFVFDDRSSVPNNNKSTTWIARGVSTFYTRAVSTSNESVAAGDWHIHASRLGATNLELWNDTWLGGYAEGAQLNAPSSSNPTAALTVGGRHNNTFNLVGDWAKIIIVSGAVSDADHQAIQEYLAYTYGRRAAFFDASTVVQHDASGNDANLFPGLGKTSAGNLILAYTKNTTHTSADGNLILRTSTDGATFGAESVLWDFATDGGGTDFWNVPRFTTLADGTMFMAVGKRVSGAAVVDGIGYFKSTDGAVSWSGPTQITEAIFTAEALEGGGILELANGDLLYPYYGRDTGDATNRRSAALLKSSDGGTTWSALATIADGPADGKDWTEPGLVQISNGNVLCLVREDVGKDAYLFTSTDMGVTWSAGTLVADCSGMMTPLRLSTGEIIAPQRSHISGENLRARILFTGDEGATWQQGRLFAESPNFTNREMVYGQFQEAADGTIYLAYAQEATGQSVADVMFAKAPG